MKFFGKVLDVLFPESCVGCGARGTLVCTRCAEKLPPASAPEHPYITSIFAYQDGRIKHLVRLLKFKNRRHVAAFFAPYLALALTELLSEEGHFIGGTPVRIVPIPLSKKGARQRGFNQAELLAREAVSLLGKEFEGKAQIDTGLLKKDIETRAQSDIKKRAERLGNLKDCFSATRGGSGAVILIDDVTTTGATIAAARSVLRAAGHTRVFAITIAH